MGTAEMMTVVVISGDSEWLTIDLVDMPASASEKEMKEAVYKQTELDAIDLEEAQVFELEPSAVEMLKAIKWPSPYDVSPTFADSQAYETAMHQAVVYVAFAKGGPVELEYMKEEE